MIITRGYGKSGSSLSTPYDVELSYGVVASAEVTTEQFDVEIDTETYDVEVCDV